MVKHLRTMWEAQAGSLAWEDPLEKEMAMHSSTLAWKIPWTEEPVRLQYMGLQRVRHDWAASLSFTEFKLSCVITSSGPKERKKEKKKKRKNKCFKWPRLRNVEEKRCLSFPPPWELQTPLSSASPGLLINLPRNWLSHFEHLFSLWAPWEYQARKRKDLE